MDVYHRFMKKKKIQPHNKKNHNGLYGNYYSFLLTSELIICFEKKRKTSKKKLKFRLLFLQKQINFLIKKHKTFGGMLSLHRNIFGGNQEKYGKSFSLKNEQKNKNKKKTYASIHFWCWKFDRLKKKKKQKNFFSFFLFFN